MFISINNNNREREREMMMMMMIIILFISIAMMINAQQPCGKQDTYEVLNFDDFVVPVPIGVARLQQPYHYFYFAESTMEYIDALNCDNPWFPDVQNKSGSQPNVLYTPPNEDFKVRHYDNRPFTLLSLKLISPLVTNMRVFVNTTKIGGQQQSSQLIVLPLNQVVTVSVNQSRIIAFSVSCVTKGSTDTCWNTHYDNIEVCHTVP